MDDRMDPITPDDLAEQRLDIVDRGYRVSLRQAPDARSGVDAFPHHRPAGASRPMGVTRRLRRTFHPVRTRFVPVVVGLVVAALAVVFYLTGNTSAIFLLVPSAVLAWMTLHAAATTRRDPPDKIDAALPTSGSSDPVSVLRVRHRP
jgi:hypothetical protein